MTGARPGAVCLFNYRGCPVRQGRRCAGAGEFGQKVSTWNSAEWLCVHAATFLLTFHVTIKSRSLLTAQRERRVRKRLFEPGLSNRRNLSANSALTNVAAAKGVLPQQ